MAFIFKWFWVLGIGYWVKKQQVFTVPQKTTTTVLN